MSAHEQTREAILMREADAPFDETVAAHLAECEDCASLAEAIATVDEGLADLPAIEPSPELLERTLEAARNQPASAEPRLGLIGLLAATFAGLFSGLWAMLRLLAAPFRAKPLRAIVAVGVPALGALVLFFVGALSSRSPEVEVATAPQIPYSTSTVTPSGGDGAEVQVDGRFWDEDDDAPADRRETINGLDVDRTVTLEDGEEANSEISAVGALIGDEIGRDFGGGQGQLDIQTRPESTEVDALEELEEDEEPLAFEQPVGGEVEHRRLEPLERTVEPGTYQLRLAAPGYRGDEGVIEGEALARNTVAGGDVEVPETTTLIPRATEDAPTGQTGQAEGRRSRELDARLSQRLSALGYADLPPETAGEDSWRGPAQRAENTRRPAPAFATATEGLTFQPARGYWRNTYVPGDPRMRALGRRLADFPEAARLAESARPADPRLDPPRQGALALRLAADHAEVEGRTRVLMSVGLRGAAQRAGRRPTLRTQVVLDLRRPLADEEQARVRALLTALSRSRDGADRTGVIVAGPGGGELMPLGRLRFGEVSVGLRRAFEGQAFEGRDGSAVSLPDALERAVTSIGQLEDEDAPLGSSLVLLVSPGLSEADARAAARVAHTGTLAGVTTTAVGLGAGDLGALERVALAGHGRRRVLAEPREATELVRAETTAISRVVARAVRLRIRLAEGVRLVDVLGSERLDAVQAQRVREAEQAIDRALAARLGITSDRGDDEDGIQIVVPAFYADDSHTVLLDLVVPGPGPVADVQVRFKDLLRLGNGTLTERLALGRGSRAPGPAQRAVMTERLAHDLATALRLAAGQIERGQPAQAQATLRAARARLESARAALPELASEPALARDASLMDRFGRQIGAGTMTAEPMAGALRYAAHRRLFGDPLDLGGRD